MKTNIAFAIALLFLLSGCRQQMPETSGGKAVIEFWNGFTGPDGATMEKLVRRFNRENRDVEVRMQIIPWATYYDKLTLGIAYRNTPDVFIVHVNRLPEFAHYDALAPIDDLADETGWGPPDFVPAAWQAARWNGRLVALPLDCHPLTLYYNQALFEKAGIARPPKNLAEFVETAKKLTRDTDNDGRVDQWGFAFTWPRSNSYLFLNQFGTGLLGPELKRSGLNTPEAAQAMNLMRSLISEHRVAPPLQSEDGWTAFQTGRVAMAMEGIYFLESLRALKSFRFGVARVPQFGPQRAVWGGSHLLALNRNLKNPRREAAWRFVKFLSDNSLEWAAGGQCPARTDLLADPRFAEMTAQHTVSQDLPFLVYEPPSVNFNLVAPFGDAAFEAILNGIRPTEQALNEATDRINDVMRRP